MPSENEKHHRRHLRRTQRALVQKVCDHLRLVRQDDYEREVLYQQLELIVRTDPTTSEDFQNMLMEQIDKFLLEVYAPKKQAIQTATTEAKEEEASL